MIHPRVTAAGGRYPPLAGARRRPRQAHTALLLGLAWVVAFSLIAWLAMLTILPHQDLRVASMVAAFVFLPAVWLWIVARAGAAGGTPLALIVIAIVALSDTSARGFSTGIDAQSVVKFGIWTSGLLLLFWRWPVIKAASRELPTSALLLLCVWAVLTTTYSATRFYTFGAGLSFLGVCITAIVFAEDTDEKRGLAVIWGALMAALALSLVLYVLVPSQVMTAHENGRSLRLSGAFGSPNNLGVAAALALLLTFLLCRQIGRGAGLALALVGLGVCGACLYLSGSRTAIISMLVGVTVILVSRRPVLAISALASAVGAGLLFLAYPDVRDGMLALVTREGSTREVTTFTGRTEIWRYVFSLIEKAPILGYGFASTKEVIPAGFTGAFGWTTHSAHNMVLQAWVATGLIGLGILLVALLALVRDHFVRPHPVRDAVTAFVLTQGLMEASIAGPTINMLIFVFLWAAALGRRPEATATPPTQPGGANATAADASSVSGPSRGRARRRLPSRADAVAGFKGA